MDEESENQNKTTKIAATVDSTKVDRRGTFTQETESDINGPEAPFPKEKSSSGDKTWSSKDLLH